MLIRPIRPTDRDEVIRMRMALWPDSTPEEVGRLVCFRGDLRPGPGPKGQ